LLCGILYWRRVLTRYRLNVSLQKLPLKIAREFVAATEAYFAEKDAAKRDEIAVLQLRSLQDHWPGKLRLHDIPAMFHQMRNEALR